MELINYLCPNGHVNGRAEGVKLADGTTTVECPTCGNIERIPAPEKERRKEKGWLV